MFEKYAALLGLKKATILSVSYNVLLGLIVVVACVIISTLVKKAIDRMNQRVQNFDETLVPIVKTSFSYLVYTIGLIIILDIFGVNTTSIVALLGTIGLAIGFALKDTLSNIAAGIMLLILRPFRVGDTIEYGSYAGKVIEINMFTTILETADGIYVSSPNGSIWGGSVKNFSKNGKRRMTISVGIGYNDSIDKGVEVLMSLIKDEKRILDEPIPQTVVVAHADSSVNLELRCWAHVDDFWPTYWDINKKVKHEIEAAGLSIPFPQRDVHIYNH